jgi:hypothetical protein
MENEMMKEWFESEAEVDAVTMASFDQYVKEWADQRKIKDDLEEVLKSANKKLKAMEGKLIEFLDAQQKDAHVIPAGRITVVERKSWKAPEGELREAAVDKIKEMGVYDAVMAFNSAKFSSWYEQERQSNPNFDLKGVEQSSLRYIQFRGKKV